MTKKDANPDKGKKAVATHERFDRDEEVVGSSDRSFGIVFACVFAIVGLWPLIDAAPPRWWAMGIAGIFLFAAGACPKVLAPLNRIWLRFGLLLHKVVNPLVMAILFYLVVTPMGILVRILGKDLLRLRLDPKATSYWINRKPPGPAGDTMGHQF